MHSGTEIWPEPELDFAENLLLNHTTRWNQQQSVMLSTAIKQYSSVLLLLSCLPVFCLNLWDENAKIEMIWFNSQYCPTTHKTITCHAGYMFTPV